MDLGDCGVRTPLKCTSYLVLWLEIEIVSEAAQRTHLDIYFFQISVFLRTRAGH